MPNCIYLQGRGKIVSVVFFFFTNKVVARASHACRINLGSNKDYLFSSCFDSIEICFRLPARVSACRCFLLSWLPIMDTGKGKTPTATFLSRAPRHCQKPAETSADPPGTAGSCLRPLHGSAILQPQLRVSSAHKTTCGWQNGSKSRPSPPGAEILLLLSLSNLIMYPWWARAIPEEGVKDFKGQSRS